jgi:hypothetical protein
MDAGFAQAFAVSNGKILPATVVVVSEPVGIASFMQLLLQRIQHQIGLHCRVTRQPTILR